MIASASILQDPNTGKIQKNDIYEDKTHDGNFFG